MGCHHSGNVLNVVLNYIMIFGKFGSRKWTARCGHRDADRRVAMPLCFMLDSCDIPIDQALFCSDAHCKSHPGGCHKSFQRRIAHRSSTRARGFRRLPSVAIMMVGWGQSRWLPPGCDGAGQLHLMICQWVLRWRQPSGLVSQLGTRDYEGTECGSRSALHLVVTYMGCAVWRSFFSGKLPFLFTNDAVGSFSRPPRC